ncbi:MAG: amidohydrolase family protein, partial [Candidatus Lokiarchaeota archaeon]|nr:amidohydrolase family protein [Candidatus Lokiarchaeota archaeon]
MNENKRSKNYTNGTIGFLLLLIVLIALLAWITYGTFDGIIGTLAFTIVGMLNVFPWFIPFVGIPLGILDTLGIFGFGMYNITLNIAHLSSSWMTVVWFWIIGILGSIIDIILMYVAISRLKKLKYRKKEPHSNYALVNCSIIDGNINNPVIKKGVVLIKNIVGEGEIPGLINGVGTDEEIEIPDDYKVIDLNDGFVLPGLINAHCHLTGSGKPMKIMNLSDKAQEKLAIVMKTWIGKKILKNMMIKNTTNALNAGVTTLRSMADPFYLDLELRNEIDNGKYLGPRLVCAGMGICITGGHGGLI